jgi:hypothetical protein
MNMDDVDMEMRQLMFNEQMLNAYNKEEEE